ncbi:TrbI/VirB10 family protein [Sphingopyxis fribergensis]
MTEAAPPASPKADPETLVLRGSPARVARFRRGAIVLLAGGALAAVAGVTWLALKPVGFSIVQSDDERAPVAGKPGDAIAGAPTSYGDVPRLGPPLPGDLGRPILKHQQQEGLAPFADPAADAAARAAAEAEAERQRLAAEMKAARESSVMVPVSGRPAAVAVAAAASPAPSAQSTEAASQNEQNASLVGRAGSDDDINPHRLTAPVSPWTLHAGTVIAASLITGLNSDLPGFVTAQITENVYDSVTGSTLLVPQGARLFGSYDSKVAYGQSRALVVWQRILLPDGSSIRIDNVPAADSEGYAGLIDRVDRHSWQLLKGVVLSTLLGVGTELGSGSSDNELVEAIRESSQQSGARAGDQIVGKSLDIQPTLKVRPGWPLRVVVHQDIVLRPWRGTGG